MNSVSPLTFQFAPDTLRPAVGTSFALIDGRPVLFSEDRQQLFELNEVAAFIWCCLQDSTPLEAISNQLMDRGLTRPAARNGLRNAFNQWLAAGLIVPGAQAAGFSFTVRIGTRRVLVRASDPEILALLRSLFVMTIDANDHAEVVFTVERISDNMCLLTHGGRHVLSCAIDELAPRFKAHVLERLLLADDPSDVIFHAAGVTFERHGMLLSAGPGTGKTTLTMHLLNAGMRYATDDIVTIGSNGSIKGASFAPTIKSDAWSLVGKLRPDLSNARTHLRGDGKRVRYLDVSSGLHIGNISVRWIVFLERVHDGTPARLIELGELDTMKRIVCSSFASSGKLTGDGFQTLKTIISKTQAFDLRYAEAVDATSKLIELCNGSI
jgi:hypothetical protein